MPASNASPDRLRILQIGAGAMGTRRLRDLSARADIEVRLFDERPDRRLRAAERFGVHTFDAIDDSLAWSPEAMIVSTPPDAHEPFVEIALDHGIHHFCEENIWTYDHRVVERVSTERGLVSAPSCTFFFLPAVQELRRVIRHELGDLHAYQMLLSTYMPHWHPDDGPEFYARQRSTAAGREMVPFELVWLNWVFGAPSNVLGTVKKSGGLEQPSEDTWSLQMDVGSGTGQLIVGHACPTDHRSGTALGTNGRVAFDVFAGTITRELPGLGISDTRYVGSQAADLERAYATEISTFVDAVRGAAPWPHDYRASSIATGTLAAAEASADTGQRIAVDPDIQPADVPAGRPELLGQRRLHPSSPGSSPT